MHIQSTKIRGILWFFLACLSFALMASVVKLTSNAGASSFTMMFLRCGLAALILLPFSLFGRFKKPKLRDPKFFFIRTFLGWLGMILMFYSVILLPVNDFVALSFSIPIFASLLAVLFLKEKMGVHRWSAIFVGFVGVLVIAQPTGNFNALGFGVCLTFCVMTACILLMVKKLAMKESIFSLVYYLHLWMAAMSVPLVAFTWQEITWEVLGLSLGIAITSIFAHIGLTKSYSLVPITLTTPFEFSRILMASGFAYLLLGEIPSDDAYIGAAIIVASATYIVRREARKAKLEKKAS